MTTSPAADPEFEALLEYLAHSRGFDFSGYKRPTLTRRVRRRIEELHLTGFSDYRDYLEVHVEEFEALFNTILINVTSFFRDQSAWDYLAQTVVPAIIDHAAAADPIRIWSAGCASGEEAYTLAIVFAEALGEDAFRDRMKIYATDIDDDALAQARAGSYPIKTLAAVPEQLRERYFEAGAQRRAFRSDLRRAIIFGRHDLTRDAPISRLDLVTCRNTLMYFNAETQTGVVHRLHYALNPGGFLFLGRAETLLRYGQLFQPSSTSFRIFTKTPRLDPGSHNHDHAANRRAVDEQRAGLMPELAFQTTPTPQLIIDAAGTITAINDAARAAFSLTAADLGRPFQDLEISYRPIDLRSPIEKACADRQPVQLPAVERQTASTGPQFFDIVVTPLRTDEAPPLGASVSFTDITRLRAAQMDLKRTTEELETAYEELQSSNEELETTNEELQSTVEELETTNEELQSTVEELETTNEELRSSNEELETTNDELRLRTNEANDLSAYLTSIVDGVSVGVIVVDPDHKVRTWNVVAEEMWGLRPAEVIGRSLYDLDSGLPVKELRQRLDLLPTQTTPIDDLTIAATNRRGHPVQCHVKFTPLHSTDKPGVVMLIDNTPD